ncbi:MAG: hypothetical protein ACI841_005409 [Planctomycetota bacterium]
MLPTSAVLMLVLVTTSHESEAFSIAPDLSLGSVDPIATTQEGDEEKASPFPERTYFKRRLMSKSARSRGVKKSRGQLALTKAVDEALSWLAEHQDAEGYWSPGGFADDCGQRKSKDACDGKGQAAQEVGITALALLAFIGDGNTCEAGLYAENLDRGMRWLVGQQDKRGVLGDPKSHSLLYNHAIATQALARVVKLGHVEFRPALIKAVDICVAARNPYGAWRYDLPPTGDNDTSVTGWMISALAAARDAGVEVEEKNFEGAITWIDEVTDAETGRVGYHAMGSFSSRIAGINDSYASESGEPMTAMAMFMRLKHGGGQPDDVTLTSGAQLLLMTPASAATDMTDHYYWYQGTRAMRAMGGKWWSSWNKPFLTKALESQCERKQGHRQGSWDPTGAWGFSGGRVYSTAIVTLALETYYSSWFE